MIREDTSIDEKHNPDLDSPKRKISNNDESIELSDAIAGLYTQVRAKYENASE